MGQEDAAWCYIVSYEEFLKMTNILIYINRTGEHLDIYFSLGPFSKIIFLICVRKTIWLWYTYYPA